MSGFSHRKILSSIQSHAVQHGEKTAIIIRDEAISYRSLYNNILKAASYLSKIGIKNNDRIILSAEKDIKFLYLYFASHIIGSINVIIDPANSPERNSFIEDKTNAAYCFGYQSATGLCASYNTIDFKEESIYNIHKLQTSTDKDIAEILFTTGTTGISKGVCLSYSNLYESASNINTFIRNTFDDIELVALPICHSFGLGRIRCNILTGGTIILMENFSDVRKVFKNIEKYNVTGFAMVPAAWAYIKKISGDRIGKYAEQLRYIEIGSSAMPMSAKNDLLRLLPATRINMHYGLTEASRSTFIEFHDFEHLNSIGLPTSDKIKISTFDENGKPLSPTEIGEICISGNNVAERYLEDNTDAFFGEYIRTGDLGYVDSDGYVYLIGRAKEIINVGGKKVAPAEVEEFICSLGIGDCICVPMKDDIFGERVKCLILKDSTTLNFDEISDLIKDKIEPYKQPHKYEWIDVIPKTASGKKQRNLIS